MPPPRRGQHVSMPPLDQFKRDGYVIIEDVLNAAEVSALRRGLDPVFSALIDQGPAGHEARPCSDCSV